MSMLLVLNLEISLHEPEGLKVHHLADPLCKVLFFKTRVTSSELY
jgi:hypothetical protein